MTPEQIKAQEIVEHLKKMYPRESIEAFLREFGEKVWEASSDWENNIKEGDDCCPDKQTAITELIKQFTHPAPGDKQ